MRSGIKKHQPYPVGDSHEQLRYSQTGIHFNMFKNKKAYKLYQQNNYKQAERLLQNAQSDFDISILASIYYRTGRYEQAATLFKQAIRMNSTNYFHYNNLGAVYKDTNQPDLAIKCFESALSLKPDFTEALYNLASSYQLSGDFAKAIDLFNQAISIQPNFTVALNNLACIYIDRGQIEKAIYKFDDIIQREPTNYAIMSNRLFALNYLNLDDNFVSSQHKDFYTKYQYNQSLPEPANKQIQEKQFVQEPFQESYIDKYVRPINNQIIQNPLNESLKLITITEEDILNILPFNKFTNKKIRIGYLSPDFRLHSVAYFIYPILKHHNKENFEVFCYSDVTHDDQVSKLIQSIPSINYLNVFHLSDKQLISQIKSDKIDILIDLSGHSAKNRLPIFMSQPAPIQISYIGYPNTTGIPNIKYRFTDHFVDPVEYDPDALYTEKLIRLSKIFINYYPGYPTNISQSNQPPTPPITINKFATYGSFNNRAKINSHVLDLWSNILSVDKTSILILKSSINSDEYKQESIKKEFSSRNIDPSRIHIYPFLDFNSHLDLYKKIDVALDTFPYSGTTTTSEALWSGVPVISLLGHHHRSRVSSDILLTLNLQSCVALTEEDYINRAVSMAHNPAYTSIWRINHQKVMLNSPFMNYQFLTNDIESNYIKLYNQEI
jgi:predicted O-linked N-acetylglucosamine transferase (SPINDLY family)